ncbi:MAG: TetR/AcrR family transcriptional regulator [Acidimicrobiales bacterium]
MNSRREQNRVRQRSRIMAAARDQFSAAGFDAVTVSDVAEAAGVARATVFNHFGSKRGLVDALIADVLRTYHSMLGVALADTTTPTPTLILALFEQMGVGIEADRRFFRGVFQGMAMTQVGIDEDGAAHHQTEASQRRLTELIERGQQRGDLTSAQPSEVLAVAVNILANGTITRWLYDDAAESLAGRMRSAALVLLEPVAAGPVDTDGVRPVLVPPEDTIVGTP